MNRLQAGMRSMHADAMAWLKPKLAAHLDPRGTGQQGVRTDANTPLSNDFEAYVRGLVDKVGQEAGPDFDKMLSAVVTSNERGLLSLGIDIRNQPGMGGVLSHYRAWNVQLMTNAGRDYASQVAEILDDPNSWGMRVEELTALIQERGDVSESRAELIARDQTLKLNGQVNQYRQQSAGIDSFTWSGSMDERERDTHLAHEGQKFLWVAPPEDTGAPGQDFQCRCVGIPVIAALGDDD